MYVLSVYNRLNEKNRRVPMGIVQGTFGQRGHMVQRSDGQRIEGATDTQKVFIR